MSKKIHYKIIDKEILAKGKKAEEDFESKGLYVIPKPLQSKLISIRLPMTMISALRQVAETKGGIGYQQLVKIYISEGLIRDQYTNQVHNDMYNGEIFAASFSSTSLDALSPVFVS